MSEDAKKGGKGGESTWAVVASIGGTAALTVCKFLAFAFGGSAAMLAEAIHSLVDTGDGVLLYVGQRRSAKPADEQHPFGYGKELYFWTLVVALVMFSVGGVATMAEGMYRVIQPEQVTGVVWNYVVLGLAVLFNGFTWGVALREFLAGKGDKTLGQAFRKIKDPTTVSILFEDSASLVGVVIAFLGIFLGQLLHMPVLDGVASILIGLVMAVVAIGLVCQCKTLLIGEPVNDELADAVRSLTEADSDVEKVNELRTLHFGPRDILLAVRVRFRPGLCTPEVEKAVERLEGAISEKHPEIKRMYIEPGFRK